MSNLAKVRGQPGLYRDNRSGGIVADDVAYKAHCKQRETKLRDFTREARINSLEGQVRELSSLVAELLRRTNGDPAGRH
jgi:hypothetical protein